MGIALLISCTSAEIADNVTLYPENSEKGISPDTHLKITFTGKPVIGNKGKIRVFDSRNDSLADIIDMSIPAGPTQSHRNPDADYTKVPYNYKEGNFTNANTKPGTPSGTALPTSDTFQLTIIGGFTDGFHFYPVIVHDSTATIYLHNNLLKYNKTYYVLIDSGVISTPGGTFKGIYIKNTWRFSTRRSGPNLNCKRLVVDDKGTGDFNTVQGALDYIPDHYKDTLEIFIKNGLYEELIYFRK